MYEQNAPPSDQENSASESFHARGPYQMIQSTKRPFFTDFAVVVIVGACMRMRIHDRLLWVNPSWCLFVLATTRIMEAETKLHDCESAGH